MVLTENWELKCVHFGLPECLVGGVAGERDVPVDGRDGKGQLAVSVPAARSCRLVPGGGLWPGLPVHNPRDHRWRVTVLGKAREGDVVADSCLSRTTYSHPLRGNWGRGEKKVAVRSRILARGKLWQHAWKTMVGRGGQRGGMAGSGDKKEMYCET